MKKIILIYLFQYLLYIFQELSFPTIIKILNNILYFNLNYSSNRCTLKKLILANLFIPIFLRYFLRVLIS